MYIKYLNNIHDLSNYKSLTKGGTKDHSILLLKEDGAYNMEFLDTDARDFILKTIWEEITKRSEYFDIDLLIDTYYEAKKYNL
jgi:hypothetical protein